MEIVLPWRYFILYLSQTYRTERQDEHQIYWPNDEHKNDENYKKLKMNNTADNFKMKFRNLQLLIFWFWKISGFNILSYEIDRARYSTRVRR